MELVNHLQLMIESGDYAGDDLIALKKSKEKLAIADKAIEDMRRTVLTLCSALDFAYSKATLQSGAMYKRHITQFHQELIDAVLEAGMAVEYVKNEYRGTKAKD